MQPMIAPTELLPDPLPADPLAVAAAWLEQAFALKRQPNPNAMSLATTTPEGKPSVRIVLCKGIVADPGYIVFYTNYLSRKGRELGANPRAAAVIHWDYLHRQVRLEGIVEPAPASDSDAYFASRALQSRIGAWASVQSAPLASRALLLEAVADAARRFGISPQAAAEERAPPDAVVPRPPHWGGYRLWVEAVELWVEGAARIHDRARWSRGLTRGRAGLLEAGAWSATRLQP